MHLCYVDDSGKQDVVTLTGLLIPASRWNHLLRTWLDSRLELTETWGVRKHAELHAWELVKGGKGRYCVTQEQERVLGAEYIRARAVDILMRGLGTCSGLTVTTLAARTSSTATAYAHFVEHLDQWAVMNDTQVIIVLDGQEIPLDTTGLPNAEVHRGMSGRRAAGMDSPSQP